MRSCGRADLRSELFGRAHPRGLERPLGEEAPELRELARLADGDERVSLLDPVVRLSTAHRLGLAEESVAGLETLQRFSSALSAAASVSDVVSTLVGQAQPVVGAPVALGFVEEGEIVITHPEGLELEDWQVLRLTEDELIERLREVRREDSQGRS